MVLPFVVELTAVTVMLALPADFPVILMEEIPLFPFFEGLEATLTVATLVFDDFTFTFMSVAADVLLHLTVVLTVTDFHAFTEILLFDTDMLFTIFFLPAAWTVDV